ncbi:cyclic-di-AMP-binding protein CbpB [Peribacillus sp. SCS-26]|uniref:cyclic-di-AMP-binding protein CbpB n=1 Tax=Paraperibacillus marinus TaxID=3115295 RepID=UPI003906B0FB
MMSVYSEELLELDISGFIIPSERVAHVQGGNNLEHALLVLTKTGYTAIPVLDPQYKLQGLLATPAILDSILGLQRIEFEQLEQKRVAEVMSCDIPRLKITDKIKKGLALLIDHPFVCVENEEGFFEGILTRRALLKKLNQDLHTKRSV